MTKHTRNAGVSWADKVYRKSITFEEPLEVGEEYLLTVNSGKIHNLDIFDSGELIGSLRDNRLSFVAERETDTLILRYYEHVDPTSWRITLERKHETPSGLDYAKEYQLTKALDPEQRYMITVEATNVDKLGIWLGREYFAGYMEDNSLIITGFDKAYDSIVIKSSSRNTRINTIMLTRGVKFEDWLPTPEDTDNRFSLIKQTVDEIIHRVGDNEDNISEVVQTAKSITQTVKNDRKELESQIIQTAKEITQTVTDTKRGLDSRITQTAKEISAEVSNNRNDISSVSVKADNISTRVSNNSGQISNIRQTAERIDLRLTDVEDNPIAGINLSKKGVKIHGDKIDLEGLVSIWNKDGTSRTQIDGDKIITGSLKGDRIEAESLHGDKIIGNTIHGDKITAGTIDAGKIGAGLLMGNTIQTLPIDESRFERNYIYMREQRLSFHAGRWNKMEIGFTTATNQNDEPYIRMGVGNHVGDDILQIVKRTGYASFSYLSTPGYSQLRMNLDGTVTFRAQRGTDVYGTLRTRTREIIDASVGDSETPNIKIPYRGELRIGAGTRNREDVVQIRDNIGGASRSLKLPGLEGYTTSNAANVRVTDEWHIVRVTSARKYKRDIEEIKSEYANNFFYNAKPVWFRSKGEADNPRHSFYGYIADDVAKIEPRLATYSSYGEVEGFAYDRVPALLHKVMLDQAEEIEKLKGKVDAIFNKLKNS